MVEQAAFAPLRQRVGLDQMIYAFSGAAPLPADVAAFFQAIGVNFSEVYGMSENSGGMTWSPYEGRPGYVGKPWPGTEVVLGDDGEVLCRGGIVSRGYLNDPQRTAETFDADGWLHTGDIGEFDADGQLRIVDRKKELIITAGGKNLSPANVEARLKSLPLVGQAAVIGDNRPYVVALLVLDPDVAPAWAAGQGLASTALPDLAKDPAVLAELERGVAEVNQHFNNVEQVKRFAVLGDEWQPDSEQLTATMKLKRRGVLSAYSDLIESLYA
jgi:long-chain acyl-CoA synthetase